jgi:hypothetical protein
MAATEEYQGFVPVTLFLPGQRIEGKVWKEGARRLLQHIEAQQRQFLPVVEARVFDLAKPDAAATEHAVLAVSMRSIRAIIPGDTTSPAAVRSVLCPPVKGLA